MRNQKIRICVAGATGWAGSALCKGIINDDQLQLVSGVSRSQSGKHLSEVLGTDGTPVPLFKDVETALSAIDANVLFEFTKPDIAKHNVLTALRKGVDVIIGTSGLTEEDYKEIEKTAREKNRAVLAVGNFAITAVLLQKLAETAAKYLPDFEIIDYADHQKIDTPSGTTLELVDRLSKIHQPLDAISDDELVGPVESRGAKIHNIRVHSLRLPSYVIAIETIFGLPDERLTIRHDSGSSATPYVAGGLLAIKEIHTFKGLKRGLDSIMKF